MPFEDYLIENANRLHDLTIKAELYPDQEEHSIFEATLIGCKTLERLATDGSFGRTVEQLSAARFGELREGEDSFRRHDSDEFRQLVDREDSFEDFLKIEYEIMVKGGLFPDIASALVNASRRALERVKERAAPASEVIEAVMRLRDQACLMGEDFKEQAAENRKWDKWKNRIGRVVKGVAGGALIGVNATTFLATLTTPAVTVGVAMGAVSGALGKELIKEAAKPFSKGQTP